MKLLYKLSFTTMSLVLLFTVIYLFLPLLATEIARYSLQQQGFTDIDIKIQSFDIQSTAIEYAHLSNHDLRIELKGLTAEYQLMELLSANIDSIQVEELSLFRKAGQKPDNGSANLSLLPSPEVLSGFLSLAWHEMMPTRLLSIKALSLHAEDGSRVFNARAEFSKLEQTIQGEIRLIDQRLAHYQTRLDISPESGIDIQLYSKQSHPLSIKLETMQVANGLNGSVEADLTLIGEILGRPDHLAGRLQADLSYYTLPDTPETHFTITLKGESLQLAGGQVQKIQADLQGFVRQQDNGYQLAFEPASQINVNAFVQDGNTLGQLHLGLPRSLAIAQNSIDITDEQGALITLSELKLGDIDIAQARMDKLSFSGDRVDDSSNSCLFNMRLTAPLITMADKQFKPSPITIQGHCPEPESLNWSVNADIEELEYEDTEYVFPVRDCALRIRNAEPGTRADSDPAELSGRFACQSSPLSDQISSQFRFNLLSNTGRVDFSIADIAPDNEAPLFESVIKDWAQPFEIVSGTLSVNGAYRWWENAQGRSKENLAINLDIVDAGGRYQGILFSGLDYQDAFEVLPELRSAHFSRLSVDHIDIAVPVNQASASFRFSPSPHGELPILEINDVVLLLLDGKLKATAMKLDLNAPQQKLFFEVEGLDLTQIVAIQQLEGLSASGRLDGTIPAILSAEGVSISKGNIIAQEPGGRIQYYSAIDTSETEKSVPGSKMVLKVLEDLYYDSLIVDVDYEPDGQLTMQLAIKGKSPQVDAQRPIHFNLKLEQNLLTLLKGLRYADGINKEIDNSVQKYYREQKKPVN